MNLPDGHVLSTKNFVQEIVCQRVIIFFQLDRRELSLKEKYSLTVKLQ